VIDKNMQDTALDDLFKRRGFNLYGERGFTVNGLARVGRNSAAYSAGCCEMESLIRRITHSLMRPTKLLKYLFSNLLCLVTAFLRKSPCDVFMQHAGD